MQHSPCALEARHSILPRPEQKRARELLTRSRELLKQMQAAEPAASRCLRFIPLFCWGCSVLRSLQNVSVAKYYLFPGDLQLLTIEPVTSKTYLSL
jgi:hypothetical protein